MTMKNFRMLRQKMNKINQRIRVIDDVIKISARQYIPPSEIASPTRDILKTLASRYKIPKNRIVEQFHDKFYALKTSPTKDKIES